MVDSAREKICDGFLACTNREVSIVLTDVLGMREGEVAYLCVGDLGNLRLVEWQSGRA